MDVILTMWHFKKEEKKCIGQYVIILGSMLYNIVAGNQACTYLSMSD